MCGPRTNRLDAGGNPDPDCDPDHRQHLIDNYPDLEMKSLGEGLCSPSVSSLFYFHRYLDEQILFLLTAFMYHLYDIRGHSDRRL